MNSLVSLILLETHRATEFIDITDEVVGHVRASGAKDGLVCVYTKHTTAAIKINENEPLLLKDMEAFLKRIAPQDAYYGHNDFSIRTVNMSDGEYPNGHAHCRHLVLGSSETIPLIDGELQLGTYQSIYLIELDRPRQRQVLVAVVGA